MMKPERREFLRKAGVSLAALGTFGAVLPASAFGQPFLAVPAGPFAAQQTVTVIRSARITMIETITIEDQDALLTEEEGQRGFLNLGLA